jgi:starch phosphorylase
VLPRHLEIIYEINRRFLDQVRFRFPNDEGRMARLSLIDEHGEKKVRMANLACVGSHAINGVAALHTELLKETVLADFYALWPEKFSNKTNGVTPRRFMLLSNPGLSKLITGAIGDGWARDLSRLSKLEPLVEDAGFREEWRHVKHANKLNLATHLRQMHGVVINPDSLFDVQVKRMHEYKRQHLNVLHVIDTYRRIKAGTIANPTPRTVFFGGKAAPGYWLAKLVIKLIHSVAEVVNHDPETRDLLRVVFIPDFNVKVGQHIYPAAELSEQISTAGKEASGTGNMKFAMNGALTIGTLDGANIEIREEVGPDNFFLFGLTADQVHETRVRGYEPRKLYEANADLRECIDLLASGYFSRGDRTLFEPLLNRLLDRDDYMLMADFPSYVESQGKVAEAYRDRERWTRMSILNSARSGKFSSDRSIKEYCDDIWHITPVSIEVK